MPAIISRKQANYLALSQYESLNNLIQIAHYKAGSGPLFTCSQEGTKVGLTNWGSKGGRLAVPQWCVWGYGQRNKNGIEEDVQKTLDRLRSYEVTGNVALAY